jgi:putative phosphoesterase
MKVALIGDIHANLPALEAVLAHIQEQQAEAVWHVGDFVGYGPFPNEVVQLLRKREDVLSIVGDHDRDVLQFKHKQDKWRKSKPPEKYQALKWAYQSLSKKNRKYLRFLSQRLRLKAKGHRILLTHGSPASDTERLTPDVSDDHLRELAAMAKADIIIVGHSHEPFARQVDGVWFINTGSVGRAGDGDPRASYAILEIESDDIQVQFFRISYDVERTVTAIRDNGLPEGFAQMLLQGSDVDEDEPETEEEA